MTFELLQPSTMAEAVEASHVHGPDALVLAGGQSALILLRQRLLNPDFVISLDRIAELREIDVVDGSLDIGAMATYESVAANPTVAARLPVLARAAGSVGSIHIRRLGTVGGSVCHADPAGDVPVALLAADATLRLHRADASTEVRQIDGFFTGLFETARGDGEILAGVVVPPQPAGATFGYRRYSFREGEYPMCVVVVRLEWGEGGQCLEARVAVGGAGPAITRLAGVEAALTGQVLSETVVDEAIHAADDDLEPMGDVRGSPAWKRRVVWQTIRTAVLEAVEASKTGAR